MKKIAIILLEKFEVGYYLFKSTNDLDYNFLMADMPDQVKDLGDFVRESVRRYTGGETINVEYKKGFAIPYKGELVMFMVFDACCFSGVRTLKPPYTAKTVIEFKDLKNFVDASILEHMTFLKTASKGVLRPAPPMTKGQKVVKRVVQPKTGKEKVKTKPSILRQLRNPNG